VMTSSTTSSNNKELTHLTPVNMNIIAAQEYLSTCLYVNQLVHPILWITYTLYISSSAFIWKAQKPWSYPWNLCYVGTLYVGTLYLLVLSHSRYSAHISLSLSHSDPQALNIWYYLSWLIITIVGCYYCFALLISVSFFEPSKVLLPIPQQSMIHMICSVIFCYFFRNLRLWPGSIFDSLCSAAIQHLI